MLYKTNGSIDGNGKLNVFNRDQLLHWICSNANKDITITIKTRGNKRSNKQNAYYWGVVISMVTDRLVELGNDFDEERTHEFLKTRFNSEQIELKDGHYIDVARSTTEMNTNDFIAYIEKIQQFGVSMLDIYIPDPNEQQEFKI